MNIFLVSRHLSPYFDPSMALLRPAAGSSHQPGFGVLSFAPCGAGFAPGPGFSAVFVGKTLKLHGKWWPFMVSCPYLIITYFDWMVDVSSGCFFTNFRMNMSEFVEGLLNLVGSVPSAHHMNGDSVQWETTKITDESSNPLWNGESFWGGNWDWDHGSQDQENDKIPTSNSIFMVQPN